MALQAAREGVSQLRLAQRSAEYDRDWPGVKANVEAYAGKVGQGALNDPVAARGAPAPDYAAPMTRVTVQVTGQVISLVPGLTLSISESASGQVERFEDP